MPFLFVGDFKILYSLTGSFGATSRYPCPWCLTPSEFMECTSEELFAELKSKRSTWFTQAKLNGRPEIGNLINKENSKIYIKK